ncbi:MAG: glycosyl transferase [Bacteroidetes bacterium CG2_30_33_31]|nr:MAG: glycosyl transferase [Bacteroidetes bacterium CG2_30_33_31]
MKVSGFTIVRNAVNYDYPIKEAIESILPLCDEVVVAIGNSTDATTELVESIDSQKVKIIHTVWNDNLREGGRVLAMETDKAYAKVSPDSDWAIYIQADECIHEKYIDTIKAAMEKYKDDEKVDGLLFKYLHFYGSYDFVGDSRKWYRREIRIIKNNKKIHSYRDAQGFRKENNKLKVKLIDAYIFHYGWVKSPEKQQDKQQSFNKMWHDDSWMDKNIGHDPTFDYSNIDSLSHFTETHPKYLINRINKMNWKFKFDPTVKKMNLKDALLYLIEKKTDFRLGEYKNYIEI